MVRNKSKFDGNAVKVAEYILEERANCIDYTTYTFADLIDVKNHIDEEKYPVRVALLNNEISKRKINKELFIQKKVKATDFENELSKIRIKPDIIIKKQDFKSNDLKTIEVSELHLLFKDSHKYKFFTIEDSSTRLVFDYDLWRHEYGFKFFYYDKINKKNYRSILHGMNNSFAFELVKKFLVNGKKVLKAIEWLEVDSQTVGFFKAIFYLFLTIALFSTNYIYQNSSSFIEVKQTNFFVSFILENQKNIFYMLIPPILFFVYRDRKQLLHFKRLTGFERFDTFMMLFCLVLLIAVLFL